MAATPGACSTQQNTPASTTGSSFPQSNSSATSPSNASMSNPFPGQPHLKRSHEQSMSSMDPFLSYDAGFWNAPHFSGSIDASQFGDEPLANYMSPTATATTAAQSAGSANSSAANGLGWNVGGQSALSGGFPWGNMSNMDIDQDWNAFMNDVQQSWHVPNAQTPQGQFGII